MSKGMDILVRFWMDLFLDCRRYFGLGVFLSKVFLKKLLEYRANFAIGMGSFLLLSLTNYFFIYFLFQQVPRIKGYSFYQVVFIFGFSLISRGIDHIFTDNLWEVSRILILKGEFFKYLIRPINPLFAVISERFLHPDGIGEWITGLFFIWHASIQLQFEWTLSHGILLLILAPMSALVFFAVKVLFASMAFWTESSFALLDQAYNLSNCGRYPLDIYNKPFQWILTWALPYAFTAYFPARILLFSEFEHFWMCLLVPISMAFLSLIVWRSGIKRFEMVGG